MADNQEQSQQAQARREARKKEQEQARKAMEEQREDRAKATAQAVHRMESTQPTPTQEENDLAKLGIAVDEKEDDGSGETIIEKHIVANQPLGRGGYETRSARARSDSDEQRPRAMVSPTPAHE